MKHLLLSLSTIILCSVTIFGQTSWIGGTNIKWTTASNWTAGVPNQNTDAIIGDANFTGPNQPEINGNVKCKDLILGNGVVTSSLSIRKNLVVYGQLFIGTNGTINANHNKTITLKGNWTNNGAYNAVHANARVVFSGTSQLISGATTFNRVQVNSSSILSFASNLTINNQLKLYGELHPDASASVAGSGDLIVKSNGDLYVYSENFTDNYPISGTISIDKYSYVNYASASITQYISSALTYGRLRISGGSTKELTANLPDLQSSNSSTGRIYIDAGILDLKTFTADRAAGGGGYILLSAGTTLKIGGTNGFPDNYNSKSISSTSTVEYYGNNQSVIDFNYGNLIFSGTTGSVVKTMPNTSLTIYGDFTVSVGGASSLSFTAMSNIDCRKDISLGASTTFDGSSFTHTFRGDWANNGTYTGSTSMCYFRGVNSNLTGTGTNNFYNLKFRASGITASGSTDINVNDHISAGWGGEFTHESGGTLTMTGTNKTIYGSGLTFYNLIIADTIISNNPFIVNGDFTSNGSFTANSGNIVHLNGTSKSIVGTGFISFYRLYVNGTITTARDFTMRRDLVVSPFGTFTATNGLATFDYYTTLTGRADLYDLVINSGKTLRLGVNSILGIANVFTRVGNLSMTSTSPNLVEYNGAVNQDVIPESYYNLTFANGATKTTTGNVTVQNDITINSGVELDASTNTISIYGDWVNNGTFTPSTSTVEFRSNTISNVYGVTSFNDFTINKSSSSTYTYLKDNVTANNIIMTKGILDTEVDTITTLGGRTGNGFIYGTITHNHAFTNGTAYYFEGPKNSIAFTAPSAGLTSVSVKITPDEVLDFDPTIESINREYAITIPAGTYTDATLRFHYEDDEMNAFEEPVLAIYKHNTGIIWDSIGYSSRNTTTNYVEQTGLTSIPGRYTFSGSRKVIEWNGSVSTAWEDPLNWTTISGSDPSNRVPNSTDAAKIGTVTFTNQPTVNAAQEIAALRFGSAKAVTLTLTDSLSLSSSTKGYWTTNKSHTIAVGSASFIVGSNLDLSDGTAGNDISLTIGTGYVQVDKKLKQKANSSVSFSGNGNLMINGNYTYVAGTFTAGTGTVTYGGSTNQTVAPFTYNNLSFSKTNELAIMNSSTIVNGDLTITVGGCIMLNDSLFVAGDISIGTSTEFRNNNSPITTLGNWSNDGTYTSLNGNVLFTGTSNQTLENTTFMDLEVDKSSGTLTLTGDINFNGDVSITNGILDLDTYLADRNTSGGTFTLSSGTNLFIAGADNFPHNFTTNSIDSLSTIEYDGTINQEVFPGITYGNISFSNGASNPKNIGGTITVLGDMIINSGATLSADSVNIFTYGNVTNYGTISPGESALILEGTAKTLSGPLTLNSLTVNGDYTVTTGLTSMTGNFYVESTGSLSFGSNDATLDGDFINKGSLTSNGTATFTGTRVQTLQLLNAITSASTGVINFNGTVSPVISSTSSPTFATVNINNTGGITASMPWTVYFACNVGAGATFNDGGLNHTFYGNFTNDGTVESSGRLTFSPGSPFSASGTIQLDGTSFTSTGEIVFAGTAPLTIVDNAPTFSNVKISNTHSSGVTAPSSWTIDNELEISSGSIFNAGTATTISIENSLLNNGTLEGGSSIVEFSGTSSSIDGIGTSNFYTLEVDLATTLTLNKAVNISKNLTSHGVLSATDRRVTFTGSATSVISGSVGSVTLSELEVNKTSTTIDLNLPLIITEDLTLTSGVISTTGVNILTLNDNAISSAGNASSFVDGPMKKIGDDAFVFPVGNGTKWARLGISAPSVTTDAFTAQYYDNNYTDTSTMAVSPTPVLNNVSRNEYWTCDRTTGTSDVTVQLFWENATESGITDFTSDLVVAHWNGSAWENVGQSAITASNPGNVTSNTVTSFSPFTFGSLSPAFNSLPIELLSFDAVLKEGITEIVWKTSTEINNDFFTIERSFDGENYETVDEVDGAGNSSTTLHYQTLDVSPLSGISYYRLKQTDFNGEFTYSSVVSISNNSTDINMLVYPNPNNGNEINLVLDNNYENVKVKIVDIRGEIVFAKNYPQTNQLTIEPNNKLKSGIYFVSITSNKTTQSKKLIVK